MTSTEDETIEKAVQGDQAAFSTLYQLYVERIYNYIYYRVGNHHESEDLTSRVFHRALAHMHSYTHQGVPFSAWLYRIAHNLVANWYRDRSRRREIPLEDDTTDFQSNSEPLERVIVKDQEKEILLKVIRMLPPERQQLIILKLVEGMSNAEIGEIMGKSEGAVKSLYHRTLDILRKKLSNISD